MHGENVKNMPNKVKIVHFWSLFQTSERASSTGDKSLVILESSSSGSHTEITEKDTPAIYINITAMDNQQSFF